MVDNTGEYFHDLGASKDFLEKTEITLTLVDKLMTKTLLKRYLFSKSYLYKSKKKRQAQRRYTKKLWSKVDN